MIAIIAVVVALGVITLLIAHAMRVRYRIEVLDSGGNNSDEDGLGRKSPDSAKHPK